MAGSGNKLFVTVGANLCLGTGRIRAGGVDVVGVEVVADGVRVDTVIPIVPLANVVPFSFGAGVENVTQGRTITECVFPPFGHTVGDHDGSQAGATPKRTFSNLRHAVGDPDLG